MNNMLQSQYATLILIIVLVIVIIELYRTNAMVRWTAFVDQGHQYVKTLVAELLESDVESKSDMEMLEKTKELLVSGVDKAIKDKKVGNIAILNYLRGRESSLLTRTGKLYTSVIGEESLRRASYLIRAGHLNLLMRNAMKSIVSLPILLVMDVKKAICVTMYGQGAGNSLIINFYIEMERILKGEVEFHD